MQLFAAVTPGDDQPRFFQLLQMLHHAEARHLKTPLESAQRLPVLAEKLIEQRTPSRIG